MLDFTIALGKHVDDVTETTSMLYTVYGTTPLLKKQLIIPLKSQSASIICFFLDKLNNMQTTVKCNMNIIHVKVQAMTCLRISTRQQHKKKKLNPARMS